MVRQNFEIGSEFWNVPLCDKGNEIFPHNTEWFVSGRSALYAIIRDIKEKIDFKRVALPSWCCDSMILPFLKEGIEVKFYSVCIENGELKQNVVDIDDCDALLLMDYFGYKRKVDFCFKGIVIKDVTHSVFCNDFPNDDYIFGSLRKWAGFYTGGFAFKNNGLLKSGAENINAEYVELRKKAMQKKSEYINGKIESKCFLNDFCCAEETLDDFGVMSAFDEDIYRAKKIDVDFIKLCRRKNAQILLNELSGLAIFSEIKDDDCPLFVPIIVPNGKRDELRKYLIEKSIYCPVHWPLSEYHKIEDRCKSIYQDEISIICDQRYDENDMKRICFEIKSFLNLR